jgi:adenylylsulfate kinase-like enzyme
VKGLCIWITGLPGSGKTSVARELERILRRKRIKFQALYSSKEEV